MRVRNYLQFIKEAEAQTEEPITTEEPVETQSEEKSTDASKYKEICDEVRSMIENTIKNSGGEFGDFITKFLKNPKDVKVENFINDSDIRDFYRKFRNDIDEILNNIKFYSKSPEDEKAFGLDEYVIRGTEKAFEEIVRMLKNQKEA